MKIELSDEDIERLADAIIPKVEKRVVEALVIHNRSNVLSKHITEAIDKYMTESIQQSQLIFNERVERSIKDSAKNTIVKLVEETVRKVWGEKSLEGILKQMAKEHVANVLQNALDDVIRA